MSRTVSLRFALILSVAFIGSGCGTSSHFGSGMVPPDWYVQRSITAGLDGVLIGYGDDTDEDEAEAEAAAYNAALEHIVRQLSPAVRVRIQNTSRQWDRSGRVGRAAGSETEFITESYIAVALQPERIAGECISGRGRHHCYTALSYDPTPLPDRLARELRPEYCIDASRRGAPSEFDLRLQRRPDGDRCRIEWELEYDRVGSYRLNALGRSWSVGLDSLLDFFPADGSPDLRLEIPEGDSLHEGAVYSIEVKASRRGHSYIFSVTETGLTQMLHEETLEREPSTLQWPGEEYEAVLDLPGNGSGSVRILFGAALCERRLSGGYLGIDASAVDPEDPQYYTYGRLLRDIERRGCITEHEIIAVRGG